MKFLKTIDESSDILKKVFPRTMNAFSNIMPNFADNLQWHSARRTKMMCRFLLMPLK